MKIIVFVHPEAITTQVHHFATALHRYHPIRAWDELVGRAKYQVNIFHKIAPNNAHNITVVVTCVTSIIHFQIVFATSVQTTKKAAKLKNAAHITASFGVNTRVDTIVAIEFALSCIQLVKSKINATIITNTTNGYVAIKFITVLNISNIF